MVCSPNWSQDADALAASEQCSIDTHSHFESEPTRRREDEVREVSAGKVKEDVRIEERDLLICLHPLGFSLCAG